MNKQQLAQRIWKSADQMRSKIDAAEYKDYILGFIFYKYLSEREVEFLLENGWEPEDVKELSEEDAKDREWVQNNLGYFIAHENLYDTWIEKGFDFDVADVAAALSAFERNIAPANRHVFSGIFKTLSLGLSKLGDSTQHQTRAIHDLLVLIKPIPMGQKADYDVLGFIYEYLINMFAANAGKKAGEFYTPHAVSRLMADIVADHLEGRESIRVYDCAAGSASLLLTIGEAVARRSGNPGKIRYFAQELKQNTYNLCRMNLVMRGIPTANISVKNADTLIDDWPLEANEFDPLRVDAACLNPPYSQKWTQPRSHDPRFDLGLAPKSKADYAFLEHSLYHLAPGGIMCIVLPHGVLFRGGEEETIRRNLLDRGHISTVIGLPADIFYGTGIPTIVMVLRNPAVDEAERDKSVLFIDGSRGFAKVGKKNELRARDIKRIFDAYKARADIEGFAHLASLEEIEANGFNLNIPRYVDSSEPVEPVDIHASMFGGVPSSEIDLLADYWQAWPTLRERVFKEEDGAAQGCGDVRSAVSDDASVAAWSAAFDEALADWPAELEEKLLAAPESVDANRCLDELAAGLFRRLDGLALVDRYAAYQSLANAWETISADLEAIQAEGFHNAARAVDAHMVEATNKKKAGADEVQDKKEPWLGRILPFGIVQQMLMGAELERARSVRDEVSEVERELAEIPGEISEQEVREAVTKEGDEELSSTAVQEYLTENLGAEIPEIDELNEYIEFLKTKPSPKKNEKLAYIEEHDGISWGEMNASKDGTYNQTEAKSRITALASAAEDLLPEGSDMRLVARAANLFARRKELDAQACQLEQELIASTKSRIESIGDEEAMAVLRAKWVDALAEEVGARKEAAIGDFVGKAEALSRKYETTMADIDDEINGASASLAAMLAQLTGNARDMEGIEEMARLLGGE